MLVQIIAIFKYVLDCWDFESIGDYKLERTVDMKNIMVCGSPIDVINNTK